MGRSGNYRIMCLLALDSFLLGIAVCFAFHVEQTPLQQKAHFSLPFYLSPQTRINEVSDLSKS